MLIPEGFAGWWRKYSAAARWRQSSLCRRPGPPAPNCATCWTMLTLSGITAVLGVLGFVRRFIAQTQPTKDDPP
jgi:hypothetical protein